MAPPGALSQPFRSRLDHEFESVFLQRRVLANPTPHPRYWALRGVITEEQGAIHVAQGKVIGGGSSREHDRVHRRPLQSYGRAGESVPKELIGYLAFACASSRPINDMLAGEARGSANSRTMTRA
jgi:hypothetical protein